MKKLILPKFIAKSHVAAYTKKDGTFVAAHEDKRQKHADLKPEHLYSKLADAEDNGGRAAVHGLANEIIQHRPDLEEHVRREAADLGHSLPLATKGNAPAPSRGEQKKTDDSTAVKVEANKGKAKEPKQRETDLNANGKKIAGTSDGVRNFWKWFGGSKAVDKDGKPLVLYHGTYSDFSEFDPDKAGENGLSGASRAIEFTDSPDVASHYAGVSSTGNNDGGSIMAVYVSIKNPLVIGPNMHNGSYSVAHAFTREIELYDDEKEIENSKMFGSDHLKKDQIEYLHDFIEKNGIPDGIIIEGADWDDFSTGENTQYIVFSGSQVKSAVSNSGEFSSKTGVITKSLVIVRADMVKA